jgi:uncharacterized membrane protein
MTAEVPEAPPSDRVDLEHVAITRAEYISAMVHLYRGEMHRATAWRLRLDTTTNWAIITTGGLLTFSFGHPDSSHQVLLLGHVLLFAFLWIESRRYRFFDVWRRRVRKIEENFFNPLLTRRLVSPDPSWGDSVAQDLSHPRFKMSRWHALHRRFHANYFVLFLTLSAAWVSKIFLHPTPTKDIPVMLERLDLELLPGSASIALVVLFYVFLGLLYFIPGSATPIRGREWGGITEENVGGR